MDIYQQMHITLQDDAVNSSSFKKKKNNNILEVQKWDSKA